MFHHRLPRYEILSPEQLDEIDLGWRRIVSELGIRFDHPEALAILAAAGQRIEGDVVFFDPDFVAEKVAGAPSQFTLRGRNPERRMIVGGDQMAFLPVSGPPFVRRGDERRDATFADHADLCRLAQHFDESTALWLMQEMAQNRDHAAAAQKVRRAACRPAGTHACTC